jgi:hypothetical protein
LIATQPATVILVHILCLSLFPAFWVKLYLSDKTLAAAGIVAMMLTLSIALARHWRSALGKERIALSDSLLATRIRIERAYDVLYRHFPYMIRLRPAHSYLDSMLATKKTELTSGSLLSELEILQVALRDKKSTWVFILIGLLGFVAQINSDPPSFVAALASVPPLLALVESAVAVFASGAIGLLILRSSSNG